MTRMIRWRSARCFSEKCHYRPQGSHRLQRSSQRKDARLPQYYRLRGGPAASLQRSQVVLKTSGRRGPRMTPRGGAAGQCVKVLKKSTTDFGSPEVSENYPCNPSNPWLTSEKKEGRPRMTPSGRAATKKDLTTDYSDDTDKKSKSAVQLRCGSPRP